MRPGGGGSAQGETPARERPVARRWAWIAAALICEYVLLSLRVDSGAAVFRGGAWVLIGRVGLVPMVAVVVATAALIMRPEEQPRVAPAVAVPHRASVPLLASHALLFALFFQVTAHVFGRADAPSGSPLAWVAAWGALGLASVLALVVGLVGLPRWSGVAAAPTLASAAAVGAAAWCAAEWSHALWRPLSLATLTLVAAELRAVFADVYCDPALRLVGVRDFTAEIGAPCSGMEGIGLITLMMLGYLLAMRRVLRFPHAVLLVPLGAVLVWTGNTVRIAALVALGAYTSPELAFGAFHSKAGWVLFCAVALGLAAFARRSSFFAKDRSERESGDDALAAYVVPLLAMLATAMVTGMFAQGRDPLYVLRVLAGLAALAAYRRWYRDIPRAWAPESALVGAVVGVGWVAAVRWLSPLPAQMASDAPGPLWAGVRVLGAVALAPICEELAFRGCLLRWLVSRDFTSVAPRAWTPLALVVSSLAFGLVHEHWALGALAGATYAAVQLRTGRLMDAVVAHAASNAVIA
ncbi:MAG TPA: exosortase E/protease, VPEID-CTERM system, partial [Polyangiaceae bacterium]|nr:exosortase E/protease, VPEID-CTERM system [Polyangiaceae bacterium]